MQESIDVEFNQLNKDLDSSLRLGDGEETGRKRVDDDAGDNRGSAPIRGNISLSSTTDNRSFPVPNNDLTNFSLGMDSMAVMDVCQELDREVESSTNRPNIIRSSKKNNPHFLHQHILWNHHCF